LAQAPLNHSETVSEVAYSRDGRSLVTSSKHLARIWAGESAEPSTRILKTDDSVIATVSKNGERVLTLSGGKGDPPNNLEIRETNTGELIAGHRLGDDERVRFALLNQDGRRCVVAISDPSGKRRTTRVFQVDAVGKASTASERLVPLATFDDNALGNSDVLSGRFDATGERLALVLRKAGATETQVALCELGTKAVRILPGEEKAEVSRVEFSPLGKYVLACFTQPPAQAGHARLWRVDGQASPSSQKLEHSTEITTAAFNRDETFLLTGSTDDNASLWRITDAEVNPVYRLNASDSNTHTADLTRVLFSPDGRHALTAARDQTAILWDLQSGVTGGKRIAVLHHAASVTDTVFSKGGNLILTFSSEPKVRVWSAATGDLLALFNPTGEVMEAGFTSDDKSVYAIAQDLVPRKWSGAPGEEQFAREIRPMSWTIAPLPLRPTDARDLGVLIGARQLDKGVIDKAKTDQLPKKWKTEWSNHSALFQSAAPNEQFFNQALEECEGTKQWFSATWYLTRLLEIAQDEKKRAELRVRRANAYEQADNYGVSFPRGIADREAAISLGQNHASDYEALAAAHLNYGNTFAKAEDANGEWDSAIKAYRVAAGLAPKSSSIHLELGEALAGSRKYAEAQEEFQRALTLTEASAENGASLRARLALTGWLMGGEAGKKQYRDICMTLKDPGTTNALLWPALLTNEFEGDQEFLEMMVNRARIWAEAAPANFYRRNTYGAALYRAGHYEEAIKQLEVARTAYLAERANLLSHRYDRVLRVPISFSVEGRPPDLVFLAMANAKLASTNPQPGRVNPAWDWMRKLRDTSELSQTVRAMGSGPWRPGSPRSYPSAYTTLAIELLYDEAFGVLRQMSTATSPPNR
jgi:FOG: WD40 repeat